MLSDLETEQDRQDYLITFGQAFNCKDENSSIDNVIVGILGRQEDYIDDSSGGHYMIHQRDYTIVISEADRIVHKIKKGVIFESNTEFYQVIDLNPDKTGMTELTVEKQLDKH